MCWMNYIKWNELDNIFLEKTHFDWKLNKNRMTPKFEEKKRKMLVAVFLSRVDSAAIYFYGLAWAEPTDLSSGRQNLRNVTSLVD